MESIFFTDEGEVLPKFEDEFLQIFDNRLSKTFLIEVARQIQEIQDVGIKDALVDPLGRKAVFIVPSQLSHQW